MHRLAIAVAAEQRQQFTLEWIDLSSPKLQTQ
jgi:hypothetical protein